MTTELSLPETAEAWWKLAQQMPRVAGPWQMHYTEEQRVQVMMVRRDIRTYEPVVMAYGPHFHIKNLDDPDRERRWWIAAFQGDSRFMGCAQRSQEEGGGGFHETIEKAQQAADAVLRQYGWLLVEEGKEQPCLAR